MCTCWDLAMGCEGRQKAGLSFQGVSSLEESVPLQCTACPACSKNCQGKIPATQPVQPTASKASTGERVEILFSLGQNLFLFHATYGKV